MGNQEKAVLQNPKGENISKGKSDQLCPGKRTRERLRNCYWHLGNMEVLGKLDRSRYSAFW